MKEMMRRMAAAVLAVALLLTMGIVGAAEESAPVETGVEEVEVFLGAEEPADESGPIAADSAVAAPVEEAAPMAAEPVLPMSLEVANNQVVTLNVGESVQLSVALEGPVTWKSGKAKVAAVDENGVVTALSEGSATLKAKAGKKSLKVKVKVVDPYKPESVRLEPGGEIQLTLQETLVLTPVLAPETARATYTWKSSKTKVVEVDNGVLRPVKEGTATITVKTQNKKTAKVKVKVVDPYKPESVALDISGTVTVKPGESFTLTPSLSPATAQATYTWKSSKAKVAAVDANGNVTAIAKGTAKISVTTQNKKSASITVKVVSDAQDGPSGAPMRMSAARYKYFRKYMSQSEFNAALAVVQPYLEQLLDKPIEDQIYGVWGLVASFGFDYTNENKHYRDPYGLLVLHIATCAGTTRTTGFCLSLLGIEYQHVHESKYEHQWTRINVNGEWWICDAFSGIGYCGPEGDPTKPIEVYDDEGNLIYVTFAYMDDDA